MTLQDAPAQTLRAPFPWFGGKSGAAPIIWRLLGNPTNYVEPFAGSLAALLGRPAHHLTSPRTETVNDLDGYLANFWRALRLDSDGVADWCIAPVNEIDLTARHRWLCERERKAAFLARMEADPDFCDPKIAGWWVWGLAAWIGTGWCSGIWDAENARGVAHQLPQLSNGGGGVHRKLPQMGPAGARGLPIRWTPRTSGGCCMRWPSASVPSGWRAATGPASCPRPALA